MRRINTFWTHLERLVGSIPEAPNGVRSCRLRAIEAFLQTNGFPVPLDRIREDLDNIEELQPAFPWRATFDGGSYQFTRRANDDA